MCTWAWDGKTGGLGGSTEQSKHADSWGGTADNGWVPPPWLHSMRCAWKQRDSMRAARYLREPQGQRVSGTVVSDLSLQGKRLS